MSRYVSVILLATTMNQNGAPPLNHHCRLGNYVARELELCMIELDRRHVSIYVEASKENKNTLQYPPTPSASLHILPLMRPANLRANELSRSQ